MTEQAESRGYLAHEFGDLVFMVRLKADATSVVSPYDSRQRASIAGLSA
jgi:hypothetical protein